MKKANRAKYKAKYGSFDTAQSSKTTAGDDTPVIPTMVNYDKTFNHLGVIHNQFSLKFKPPVTHNGIRLQKYLKNKVTRSKFRISLNCDQIDIFSRNSETKSRLFSEDDKRKVLNKTSCKSTI